MTTQFETGEGDSMTQENWREVSQAEFYRVIGPQNVHPQIVGKWPYTSLFKTPNGDVRGKYEEGKRYLLPGLDPRDPDYSRKGIFVYHNCWKCDNGRLPCKGEPRCCEYLHARND